MIQILAMTIFLINNFGNHGKQLVQSNFLERILILKEIAYHLKKTVYLVNLLKKGLQNLEIGKNS